MSSARGRQMPIFCPNLPFFWKNTIVPVCGVLGGLRKVQNQLPLISLKHHPYGGLGPGPRGSPAFQGRWPSLPGGNYFILPHTIEIAFRGLLWKGSESGGYGSHSRTAWLWIPGDPLGLLQWALTPIPSYRKINLFNYTIYYRLPPSSRQHLPPP